MSSTFFFKFNSLIRLQCLFLILLSASSSPPDDPIKCSSSSSQPSDTTIYTNCTITNAYGIFPDRSICRAGTAVYPSSESELLKAVAEASKNKKKMKVATRYSHSIPKLVCPDGDEGLLISTKNMNKTLTVDRTTMLMRVESGVTLKQVIQDGAKAGLALPYAPYWWGLTVGGLLGTGAHGSSLWGKGSSVHEYVEEIRVVTVAGADEGYAKIRVVEKNDPDMDAVKVSLGVLGVISQVTFRLQPIFKRSFSNLVKNDSDLGSKATSFGNEHEFADITWYPSQRKVLYRMDDRVPANVSGNGLNDFVGFRPTLSLALATIRSLEETQEAIGDDTGKCATAKLTTSTLETTGFGYTNNGIVFTGYPITGLHNRLQASGSCVDSLKDALITACPWDPRVKSQFFHQTTFSIGLSKVKSFIEDVQKLRDLEPKAFCGLELYNGILMRYVKASSPYLGKQEDGIDFDITYYRSKNPMTPRLHEDILEEVEQMGLSKYGGLPHWGKNRNIAFDGVIKKYRNGEAFLKVKERYDPLRLFSSEWTNQVLGLQDGVTILKEGCALEGLCICSEDSHCAPNKGYVCRPGRVYKDARVCTRLSSTIKI